MKKDFWIRFLFAFLLAWLVLQLPFFRPSEEAPATQTGSLLVETTKSSYGIGEPVILNIQAGSGAELLEYPSEYPAEPFEVRNNGAVVTAETKYEWNSESLALKAEEPLTVDYSPWVDLFKKPGSYTISVPYGTEVYSTSFTVHEDNMLSAFWNTFFSRPIYNLLVWFSVSTGGSLAAGIILLTLLLRLILFVPSHKALASQRKMQKVQPKLDELRKKYKNDQQKLAQETMALFKKEGVSPLGGCLPILFQLPILLALFFTVQNVLNVSYTVLLYKPLEGVNVQELNSMFLGIDLSRPEILFIPLTIAVLQYIQISMSMAKNKGKEVAKPANPNMPDPQMMQKGMKYFLPGLIWLMAMSLPAGVGLYWGTSTLFSMGQQFIVNRSIK